RHSVHSYFVSLNTASNAIYSLSLHDALPISELAQKAVEAIKKQSEQKEKSKAEVPSIEGPVQLGKKISSDQEITQMINITEEERDRKSTRLNSSHVSISYAVFCLKKKNNRSR